MKAFTAADFTERYIYCEKKSPSNARNPDISTINGYPTLAILKSLTNLSNHTIYTSNQMLP